MRVGLSNEWGMIQPGWMNFGKTVADETERLSRHPCCWQANRDLAEKIAASPRKMSCRKKRDLDPIQKFVFYTFNIYLQLFFIFTMLLLLINPCISYVLKQNNKSCNNHHSVCFLLLSMDLN